MTFWVVDASVALKWCLPAETELLVPQALDLLASYRRGEVQFLVPDLFWPEVANAVWKSAWKQKIDHAGAETAYAKIAELDIPTIPSYEFIPKALQLAVSYRRTVYDSLYIALAMQSRAAVITADERLVNAVATYLPVKWLGAL